MKNSLKLSDNIILNADSYKISHWMFLEDNTEYSFSYVEARLGAAFDYTVVFGIDYILQTGFSRPITKKMVDQAEALLTKHGEPFNRAGWDYIVNVHNGYFPIRIRAAKEGSIVPVSNALITVESTDPKFNAAWAASFVETDLMRVWYPITVATLSREMKKVILRSLIKTGDPALIPHKLVDFGSRGVSCKEQSMIGGAAHLVNFRSTDNLLGIAMAMDYYNADDSTMDVVGDSIPATEHSVTTSWGKLREFDFFENIVDNILPKHGICSVVCDTYNLMGAIEMFGKLRSKIEKNGVIVIRPDSGDPVEVTEQVVRKLDGLFGSTVNSKGYKVLNPCVRVIQGDGIDLDTLKDILDNYEKIGYSADNITFGSGGGLLQKVNRDTMRFAMKASHVVVNGEARDIQKVPLTDPTKASKKGKLMLVKQHSTGQYRTVNQHDDVYHDERDALDIVYDNGHITRHHTSFEEIRERAKILDSEL